VRLSGITLIALILAGCGVAEQPAAAPVSAGATSTALSVPAATKAPALPISAGIPTRLPRQPTITPTAPPTTTQAPVASQQTYRNKQAGFSVDYPSDWTASEQATADGAFVTTFTPPDDRAAITVIVRRGEQAPEPSDIPNTRCQPVSAAGLAGVRCFDTISLGTSTTLVGGGKTFTIATSSKRADQSVYQQILDSFTPI